MFTPSQTPISSQYKAFVETKSGLTFDYLITVYSGQSLYNALIVRFPSVLKLNVQSITYQQLDAVAIQKKDLTTVGGYFKLK